MPGDGPDEKPRILVLCKARSVSRHREGGTGEEIIQGFADMMSPTYDGMQGFGIAHGKTSFLCWIS